MNVKTRFFYDKSDWVVLDRTIRNNEYHSCTMLCENHGSMIAIDRSAAYDRISVQVGSWTLEYRIL